jgi:hypothetical protein
VFNESLDCASKRGYAEVADSTSGWKPKVMGTWKRAPQYCSLCWPPWSRKYLVAVGTTGHSEGKCSVIKQTSWQRKQHHDYGGTHPSTRWSFHVSFP